ncbi:MAG: ribosome recycling factor [Victivallaceae bacterium]|nr:ribosome recycling factor [Victivallaceae bacterium]
MYDVEVELLVDEIDDYMKKAETALKNAFAGIRTGKASPSMLDGVMVDYYGAQTRVRDIANITAPEPRLLVIQPWDAHAVSAIEKAILTSDLGITPMSDGRLLRLPIPELSQERRQTLARQAKSTCEDAKVSLRNIRREGNETAKKAEKDGKLTEDELKKMLDDIQKLTDSYIANFDAILATKEKELMTV